MTSTLAKVALLTISISSCVHPTVAQDIPKLDFFAGYSFLHSPENSASFDVGRGQVSGDTLEPHQGFNASVTGNLNRGVGLTADLSGYYNDLGVKTHNFLIGPQLSFRQTRHFTPYLHALFGISHQSATVQSPVVTFTPPFTSPPVFSGPKLSGSNTSFAMALGGGADYNISRRLSIRLVQADYLRNTFKSEFGLIVCDAVCRTVVSPTMLSTKHNHLRLSFGVVFHL